MPTERTMGADHIGEGGGSFEPQRPFNFVLVLPQDKIPSADKVELGVASFSVPNRNIQKITIPFLNEERHVAGGITFEDATLVVVDYVDPNVLANLEAWYDMVYDGGEDGDGGIGLARDYKADCDLKIQHGEFSYAQRTETKQINCTFSVDRMYLKEETGSA